MKFNIISLVILLIPFQAFSTESVIDPQKAKSYIDSFNLHDEELYKNVIPNDKAWEFLKDKIPLLDCPDEDIQKSYYFRWWTLRKHLIKIDNSWAITEFVPKVHWSWDYNLINCANSHHINEARWLKDSSIARDNLKVWILKYNRKGYSSWLAYTLLQYVYLTGEVNLAQEMLPNLMKMFEDWEKGNRDEKTGIYFQNDAGDGMEGSIAGGGFRPTINSYVVANAMAISELAKMTGNQDLAEKYRNKSNEYKKLLFENLWNPEDHFFEVKNSPWPTVIAGVWVNGDKALTKEAGFKCATPAFKGFDYDLDLKNSWTAKEVPQYRIPRGTQGWVEYKLPKTERISSVHLFFGRSHIPVHLTDRDFPEAIRISYKKNGEWTPVKEVVAGANKFDIWNEIKFSPVETQELRIECDTYGYHRDRLQFVGVREQIGFVPWYFNIPEARHSIAWKEALDPKGFKAKWGLTTAEQRHPKFEISYTRHECLWNGPAWPFATSQTLTALANLLNNYDQNVISNSDYFEMIKTYAFSHQRTKEDGTVVPWIDEDQNPFTGEWIARKVLETDAANPKNANSEKFAVKQRGKDYNHSTYCDLIIEGLIGVRPQEDQICVINPLIPEGKWKYFCLEGVPYSGHLLTILWDETGERYKKGKGFRIFADGKEIAAYEKLQKIRWNLKTGLSTSSESRMKASLKP